MKPTKNEQNFTPTSCGSATAGKCMLFTNATYSRTPTGEIILRLPKLYAP